MNVHCINVNKSLDENLFCLMSYSSCFLENQGFVVCWHINLQHGIKFVNIQFITTYGIWTRTWILWNEWSLYWWIIRIFYLLSLVETCCFEGQASPHLQHLSLPICCLYDQWWELCHRMIAVSWPSVKVSVMCKAIQRKEGDRFEH